jgi:hypothetical protein
MVARWKSNPVKRLDLGSAGGLRLPSSELRDVMHFECVARHDPWCEGWRRRRSRSRSARPTAGATAVEISIKTILEREHGSNRHDAF